MGRPPLDVGTWGDIRPYREGKVWRAEANFRDEDDVTRPVKRHGQTKAKAIAALEKALKERRRTGDLTRETRFFEVGELWLAEVEVTHPRTTYDRYRTRLRNKIVPEIGELRLRVCTPGRMDRYLRDLKDTGLSPNTVRTYRTVLSEVFNYAVRMDAIERNPVNGAGRITGGNTRATKRALTPIERTDLLSRLDADERARGDDLPDPVRYLMGTGVRLGEVMGLRWCRVDLEIGVSVHGDNLVREIQLCATCGQVKRWHKGKHVDQTCGVYVPRPDNEEGLVLHEPKTPAGFRVLPLPDFVVMMLRLRYPGPEFMTDPVFPNGLGTWRDPNNTGRSWRKFRVLNDLNWITPHVFRRTAITIMDQQGLSPREVAGYAGHARPSFTQDTYMDLKPQSGRIAPAMDRAYRTAGW